MKRFDTSKSVFYERYKPQCLDDVILPEVLKSKLKRYVKDETLPNLGFFSVLPGSGKSSCCNAILKDIGGEALWINASLENGIDVVRGKILKFAQQTSFDDKMKVVVMDECDNLSQDFQKAFRGFIDEFNGNCKFIFTGNYKDKIIQPLLDRLEVYDFSNFKREDMVKPIFERLNFILTNEGIKYDPKNLIPVINTYYPRIRSMIGAVQKFSSNGTFEITSGDMDDTNVFDDIIKLCSVSTYNKMIDEINSLNAPSNVYTFLYKNAEKYFPTKHYPNVVVTVAKYQHMSAQSRDEHLCCASCLTELMSLRK